MNNSTYILPPLDELIQGCKRNDRYSQSRLYQYLSPIMITVCQRYSQHTEDAKERLQEGFITMFKNIDQYRGEGSFEGWVRRIFVTTCLQHIRSQHKMAPIVSWDDVQLQPEAEQYIQENMEARELIALVQSLPPMYKAVFNLYVFEGMKHREIAAELGISEGTSKSNLRDARLLLQKKLHALLPTLLTVKKHG